MLARPGPNDSLRPTQRWKTAQIKGTGPHMQHTHVHTSSSRLHDETADGTPVSLDRHCLYDYVPTLYSVIMAATTCRYSSAGYSCAAEQGAYIYVYVNITLTSYVWPGTASAHLSLRLAMSPVPASTPLRCPAEPPSWYVFLLFEPVLPRFLVTHWPL